MNKHTNNDFYNPRIFDVSQFGGYDEREAPHSPESVEIYVERFVNGIPVSESELPEEYVISDCCAINVLLNARRRASHQDGAANSDLHNGAVNSSNRGMV